MGIKAHMHGLGCILHIVGDEGLDFLDQAGEVHEGVERGSVMTLDVHLLVPCLGDRRRCRARGFLCVVGAGLPRRPLFAAGACVVTVAVLRRAAAERDCSLRAVVADSTPESDGWCMGSCIRPDVGRESAITGNTW